MCVIMSTDMKYYSIILNRDGDIISFAMTRVNQSPKPKMEVTTDTDGKTLIGFFMREDERLPGIKDLEEHLLFKLHRQSVQI